MVALCGRLQLMQTVPGLGETVVHREAGGATGLRAGARAAGHAGGARASSRRRMEDEDRAVRLAAVRAVGARGYKGALRRIEGDRARARRSATWI